LAVSEPSSFIDLIHKAQAHDEQAAAELMGRYEPAVRRVVRLRLLDARLRRVLDSVDVCQSVMANFFEKLAHGGYPLQSPEQLIKLLSTMAHNKLTDHMRRQHAQRRDNRQTVAYDIEEAALAAPGPSPSQAAATRELLDEVRGRLSDDELQILELRNEGQDWADIAADLGGTPDALRKKLARALARVQQEVGIVG
jgi:RNA polymerase sigma factor (sigma-70 family)